MTQVNKVIGKASPKNINISNGFWFGFWATLGAFFVMFILQVVSTSVKPDDVREACLKHQGVAVTRNINWSISEYGTVAITCKDGYYTTR